MRCSFSIQGFMYFSLFEFKVSDPFTECFTLATAFQSFAFGACSRMTNGRFFSIRGETRRGFLITLWFLMALPFTSNNFASYNKRSNWTSIGTLRFDAFGPCSISTSMICPWFALRSCKLWILHSNEKEKRKRENLNTYCSLKKRLQKEQGSLLIPQPSSWGLKKVPNEVYNSFWKLFSRPFF